MKELLKSIIFSTNFIMIILVIIGMLSAYCLYPDNPIEEISEILIEKETGISIDLTPENSKDSK